MYADISRAGVIPTFVVIREPVRARQATAPPANLIGIVGLGPIHASGPILSPDFCHHPYVFRIDGEN
jgi:hypothetical protein